LLLIFHWVSLDLPRYIPRVSYPGELFGLLFGQLDAARCLRIISEVFVELRAELSGEVRVRAQTRENGEKSKTVERRKNCRVSSIHYLNVIGIGNPPTIPPGHRGTVGIYLGKSRLTHL
jgi:hypothetical protein